MDLCVTADDYGATAGANAAIEELATRGAIGAVSVMTHADARLTGVARLAGAGAALGLHLVFTGGRPLLEEVRHSALADPDGRLPPSYRALFARLLRAPRARRLLEREAAAQARRFCDEFGVAPRFVNGHEHAHLFPLLWPAVASLAERFGAAVRTPIDRRVGASADGLLAASSRLCWSMRPLRGDRAVLSPIGGAGRARRLTAAAVERMLGALSRARRRRGVIAELVVHPDPDEGASELALLRSGALDALLARLGIRRATLGAEAA